MELFHLSEDAGSIPVYATKIYSLSVFRGVVVQWLGRLKIVILTIIRNERFLKSYTYVFRIYKSKTGGVGMVIPFSSTLIFKEAVK